MQDACFVMVVAVHFLIFRFAINCVTTNKKLVSLDAALESAVDNPVDGVLTLVHGGVDPSFVKLLCPDDENLSIKVVANCGVGVDHIDLAGALLLLLLLC